MVKLTPMIRISNRASGFTALEILLATALIGIVSTVGLPQTDLFAELSDRGDATAAAAEAQNRVNVKFTELLISGLACEKAADRVSDLALVSDGRWAGGEVFKDYVVSPRYLERFETVLTLERLEPKADGSVRRFENLVAIQTPRCGDEGYEAPNVDALRKKLNNDGALNIRSMLSDAEETALLQKVKNQAAVFLKKAQGEWHRFFSPENESTQ